MTKDQIQEFEFFLWDCFKGESRIKELRLSQEEILYLKSKYPNAVITEIPGSECSDGKLWFKVAL